MAEELTIFAELEAPIEWAGHGWYVGAVGYINGTDNWYLHTNGIIYNTCAPRDAVGGKMLSTGWHVTEKDAISVSRKYYNQYGLAYPYNIPVAAGNKKESQVMEFE